jgi:hypothetical protein
MKKLDPREFGLNDNASSPKESARVGGRFYAGIVLGVKSKRIYVRFFAFLAIVLFAFLLFISFFPSHFLSKQVAQSAITLMPASAAQQSVPVKDQLFYTN